MISGVYRARVTNILSTASNGSPIMVMSVVPQVSGATPMRTQVMKLDGKPMKVGTEVWVSFEGGDTSRPVVVGLLSSGHADHP